MNAQQKLIHAVAMSGVLIIGLVDAATQSWTFFFVALLVRPLTQGLSLIWRLAKCLARNVGTLAGRVSGRQKSAQTELV
jgi:hypothetical protein